MKTELIVERMYQEYLRRKKLEDFMLYTDKSLPSKNVVTDQFYEQRLKRLEECINGLKGVHEEEMKRGKFITMYGNGKLKGFYDELKYNSSGTKLKTSSLYGVQLNTNPVRPDGRRWT